MFPFTPFPYAYLAWLCATSIVPIIIIWIRQYDYLKNFVRLYLYISLCSVLCALPWDIVSTHMNIWYFEEPYVMGVWLLRLPIEEWSFFILTPHLFTLLTLVMLKRYGIKT